MSAEGGELYVVRQVDASGAVLTESFAIDEETRAMGTWVGLDQPGAVGALLVRRRDLTVVEGVRYVGC